MMAADEYPIETQVAALLLRACESSSGKLRPWRPFDVHQVASEVVALVREADRKAAQ